jgi:hypothetical protein
MHKSVPILIVLLTLATSNACAYQITNGSFEDTSKTFVGDGNKVDALPSGSLQIPGWTTFNGVPTAWIENGNPWAISASDGSFFLDLTGYGNHGTYGGVMQSFATVPGTDYIATFDIGYGGNSGGFGGPVSVLASAAGSSATFTSASGTPNPAVWNKETFSFMATSSTTELSFKGISTAGGFYIGLDNVDVEAGTVGAVPELGTFALLLTGMAFLGEAVRRRAHR